MDSKTQLDVGVDIHHSPFTFETICNWSKVISFLKVKTVKTGKKNEAMFIYVSDSSSLELQFEQLMEFAMR